MDSVLSIQEDEEVRKKKELYQNIIEEHLGETEFNIYSLAMHCKIPESRLYKEFKQYFGMTFTEFLEARRISKACELLIDGVPVKAVTEQTGYLSDISFRRAFKRVMGVPPSKYVEMQKL